MVGVGLNLALIPATIPSDNNNTTTTLPITNPTGPTNETQTSPELKPKLEYEGIEISYLRYAGFKLKFEDTVVYLDPFAIWMLDNDTLESADYIVITHAHMTHCSPTDIETLSDSETTLISSQDPTQFHPEDNKRQIDSDIIVEPGDILELSSVRFEFVPMYNIKASRTWAHPNGTGDVGVIVQMNGVRIYFASDTDRIPEMKTIEADIAILPVSGYAEMSAYEAAEAVEDLNESHPLKYAIPMHWNSYSGNVFQAYIFHNLANCTVAILDTITSAALPSTSSIP